MNLFIRVEDAVWCIELRNMLIYKTVKKFMKEKWESFEKILYCRWVLQKIDTNDYEVSELKYERNWGLIDIILNWWKMGLECISLTSFQPSTK